MFRRATAKGVLGMTKFDVAVLISIFFYGASFGLFIAHLIIATVFDKL
jgi:hypothetical protein